MTALAAIKEARLGTNRHPHPHVVRIERGFKEPDTFVAELVLDARVEPYLNEHRVEGMVVVPGACQLELALAAGRHAFGSDEVFVEDVQFRRPVVLPEKGDRLECKLDVYSDEGHFEICSRGPQDDQFTKHTRGRINHSGDRLSPSDFDLEETRTRIHREVSVDEIFRDAAEAGLELGPAFRSIKRLWHFGDETLALIEPAGLDCDRFVMHPALVESAIQTAALGAGKRRGLFLPFKVARVSVHRSSRLERLWCYSLLVERKAGSARMDIVVVDEHGEPVMTIAGLTLKHVHGSSQKSDRSEHYESIWEERPLRSSDSNVSGTWLVLADRSGIADRVAEHLRNRAERVLTIYESEHCVSRGADVFEVDPRDATHFETLLESVDAPVSGIVQLFGLSVEPNDLLRAEQLGPVATSMLLSALGASGKLGADNAARAFLVTCGAMRVLDGDAAHISVGGGAFWGFGRVMMSEERRLTTTLVDLGTHPSASEIEALLREIDGRAPDYEVALRGEQRFAQKLRRVSAPKETTTAVRCESVPFRAESSTPGVLSSVGLQAYALENISDDEVLIAVRACGLNFKDVVVGMALLPDEAWEHGQSGAALGMDCAGVVLRIGKNVSNVQVGDEVVGFARHCLGNRGIAHRQHVVKKPASLSFADAAAIPTVFLTASLALEDLARVQPGEIILIHAAAGGVGLAAIQVARRLGARVFATTSTEQKREYLENLGIERIFNSRSSDFRDAVLGATDGHGVDVVLNSLSGRALTQGIRSLAPFGRFIEIGKTDIYENRQIGLGFFAENRTYSVLDVNRWVAQKKPLVAPRLQRVLDLIESAAYEPLPIVTFPIAETARALGHLAQAKHIGKVVVEVPDSGTVAVRPRDSVRFDDEAAHVVTGGCRGFGLACAEWLADRGARHLVLVSRSGPSGHEDKQKIDALRARGINVSVRACDVGDPEQVRSLFDELAKITRIGSLFHAAMVLDDAPISALTPERFRKVSHPKAIGAWNLHQATLGLSLDHFVMFSSIASVVGTPGQANYAAASASLEALAHLRRGMKLPATAIHWGGGFDVGSALEMLERTLLDGASVRLIADVDWAEASNGRGRKNGINELANGCAAQIGGAPGAIHSPSISRSAYSVFCGRRSIG